MPDKSEPIKGVSPWTDAYRRLRRNRMAIACGIVFLIIALAALVGPWLVFQYNGSGYDTLDLDTRLADSSVEHPLGTDTLGRDLLARVLYGSRISLLVGIVGTLISLLIGVAYGALAGYFGGRVDELMMRIVDVLYSLPDILFIVILMTLFDRSFLLLLLALGAMSWLTMASIARGQVLSLKNELFVEAARSIGVSPVGIIVRHIVPNALGPIIVYATLTIPSVILAKRSCAFSASACLRRHRRSGCWPTRARKPSPSIPILARLARNAHGRDALLPQLPRRRPA